MSLSCGEARAAVGVDMMHWASVWACSAYTVTYVGSLYVLPALYRFVRRRKNCADRRRDDPSVIRERLCAVSAATVANVTATGLHLRKCGVLSRNPLFSVLDALCYLGLVVPKPSFLTSALLPLDPPLGSFLLRACALSLRALVLTALLYAGTLYADWTERTLPGQARCAEARLSHMVLWRNYAVVCLASRR